MEREAATTKIQAAFRGYTVRRRKPLVHLRQICGVRQKLNGLEAKAADPAYMERVCVDVMECRKLTEGIMALLLELDGLQGVDPAVRDIRKSVNREVVQFMEVIDAVVGGATSSTWQDAPGIVRSNSMSHSNPTSHFDRSSSSPLRRMPSLDNHIYPEQSYDPQLDTALHSESQEGSHASDRGAAVQAERTDDLLYDMPTYATCESESESVGTLMGTSRQEGENYHSEADSADRIVAAALVIQSRFRGHRVRCARPLSHLRNIYNVKSKLRELSIQVSNPDFPLKLRVDNMERLKLTESITALLLQLDSVQGVDQVVRDIRKSVTKEVFKLQELVDTMIVEAENAKGSTLPSVENNKTVLVQRNLEDFGGEIPEATLVCHGKNEPCHFNEIESLGNRVLNGVAVRDNSASEGDFAQPLDLEPWNISSPVSGVDKSTLATPGSDQQRSNVELDRVAINPSTECDTPTWKLDDVQVRVLDVPMQNSATSCSSSECAEEHRLNDQQSGPCAAVFSAHNYSCDVYDEYNGTVTPLKSESSPVGMVSGEENISSKLENRQWHNQVVDVPSSHAILEDLQASVLPGVGRDTWTTTSISFVRHMYDAQHMETCGVHLSPSIVQQEIETRNTSEILEVNSRDTGTEHFEALNNDNVPVSVVEADLIVQKYNFIPSPSVCPSSNGERMRTSNISIQNKGENLQPFVTHTEGMAHSGMQYFDESPHQIIKASGEKFLHDGKIPVPNTIDCRNYKESSSLLQPGFGNGAPAEHVKKHVREGVEASPMLTKEELVSRTVAEDLSSLNHERFGLMDAVGASSAAIVQNNKQQDLENMELIGQLVDENAKLRDLLNEVLIFAEMQSSKVATVKGRLEKLEGEVIHHKKREDIWRKKSKSARRRR